MSCRGSHLDSNWNSAAAVQPDQLVVNDWSYPLTQTTTKSLLGLNSFLGQLKRLKLSQILSGDTGENPWDVPKTKAPWCSPLCHLSPFIIHDNLLCFLLKKFTCQQRYTVFLGWLCWHLVCQWVSTWRMHNTWILSLLWSRIFVITK